MDEGERESLLNKDSIVLTYVVETNLSKTFTARFYGKDFEEVNDQVKAKKAVNKRLGRVLYSNFRLYKNGDWICTFQQN